MAKTLKELQDEKRQREAELKKLELIKKQELEEMDEEIKKEQERLENALDEVPPEPVRLEDVASQARITEFADRLRHEEELYAVTDYNVLDTLYNIRNRLNQGEELSEDEEVFLDAAREGAGRFRGRDDYLQERDPMNYVQRTEDLLKQIDDYVHLRG